MIGRYVEHMKGKSTHERRTHAMQVAGVFVALVFVGWVGSLSLSVGSGTPASSDTSQAAAAAAAQAPGNQLVSATSSSY